MATRQPRTSSVLTFSRSCVRLRGFVPQDQDAALDADIVIAFAACQGAGKAHLYQAPDRDPLYAINGRPC